MAGELIWSRAALDDIDAIAFLIARDSHAYARRAVEKIVAYAEHLAVEKRSADRLPALDPRPVHEGRVGTFRILYERQGDDLHILAVLCAAGT